METLTAIPDLPLAVKILASASLVAAALLIWAVTGIRVVQLRVGSFEVLWLSGLAGMALISLNVVVWGLV